MNKEKVMTPANLLALVKKANKGDFIEYYKGSLILNQTKKKYFLSQTALLLYGEGLVLLSQKRFGGYCKIYYAIRTSNPFEISKYTTDEIERMMR